MGKIRLDKFLSEQRIASRSQLKGIIKKQSICVNGMRVFDGSIKVDPNEDTVSVDGAVVGYVQFQYIMLNKPKGYITATKDNNDKTVLDIIGDDVLKKDELSPVGRLDKDTTGLLLLTNDGELNHRLLSSKYHVEKKYLATLNMPLKDFEAAVKMCVQGIDIGDDKKTLPSVLEKADKENSYYLSITEGRYHQVKRMFKTFDTDVVELKRVTMGNLILDEKLKEGDYRFLTDEEIKTLKMSISK